MSTEVVRRTGWVRELDGILRGDATRLARLREGVIPISAGGISVVILCLGVIYGACMGAFSMTAGGSGAWMQMVASAMKVPALFFLTLVVTFPSLYVFNALVGSKLSVISMLRLLIGAMGVMLAVLASFGTIVLFFSFSTTNYSFILLLNVAVFSVAGILGLRFLLQTLHQLVLAGRGEEKTSIKEANPEDPLPPPIPGALEPVTEHPLGRHVKVIFRLWVVLFAVVGSQMGWILRPFVGNKDAAFTWFCEPESSFFGGVWEAVQTLIGG